MSIEDGCSALNVQSLRYFLCAAEMGNLTAAAASVGIAQSALSRHVAQLEALVGGRIFFRTGRGVELTELGRAMVPRATSVLREARQLIDETAGLRHHPEGMVNIGLPPAICGLIMSRLLNCLLTDYPKIRLRVFETHSGEIEAMLSEGHLDIGLFNRYRPSRYEKQEMLFTTRMLLVAKAGSKGIQNESVRFSALAGLPLILPRQPNSLRSFFDEIANRKQLKMNVVLEVSPGATMREVLLNCDVYSILPPHALKNEMMGGMIDAVPITHPFIRQMMFIDTTRRHPMSSASKKVLHLLTQLLHDFSRSTRP